MFDKLLDKLDSWIGRSFILTSFVPAVLFVFANILLARAFFPSLYTPISTRVSGTLSGVVDIVTFVGIVCVVLAYITDPLAQKLTDALNGDCLPGWVKKALLKEKTRDFDRLSERHRLATIYTDEIQAILTEYHHEPSGGGEAGRLVDARAAGFRLRKNDAPDLIAAASKLFDPVWRQREEGRDIDAESLRAAMHALALALENNCPLSEQVMTDQDLAYSLAATCDPRLRERAAEIVDRNKTAREQSNMLDDMYRRARLLLAYAVLNARYRQSIVKREIQRRWPNMPDSSAGYFTPIQPTAFGNIFVSAAAYTESTFGFDLDFMLPILQSALASDSAVSDGFAKTQQQLNFSIRLYLYVCLSIVLWLILVTGFASRSWTVALVGTVGLVVVPFGLSAILASARAFVEGVKTVCILKRFNVIEALHIDLPPNADEERKTWNAISKQLQWGERLNMPYGHGPKK